MSLLPAAGSKQQLVEERSFPVFNGQLKDMPGSFSIYSGYRLENSHIVYNRFPTVFTVSDE